MKFAAHRDSGTLGRSYLDNLTTVDGAASFLGLEARRDITKDFRSASMRRNPNLPFSLPAKLEEELQKREDYVSLSTRLDDISFQIKAAMTEEMRDELRAQQKDLYEERRKLREQELRQYQLSHRRAYSSESAMVDYGDLRRTYFDDVVRHMIPERAYLADNLNLAVHLRSPEGISVLENILALLSNDSRVAYQEVLRPINGHCRVPSCKIDMER
jgi:hypothetical protein